jgi:hypothetical protein
MVTAPSTDTMGSCSSSLVRSSGCGDDDDVQEPSGEEPFRVGFR